VNKDIKKYRENSNQFNLEIKNLLNYYKNNKFDIAEQLSLQMIEKFPDEQLVWKILSMIFLQTERVDKAIDANKKAVELNPKDFEAHNNLGMNLQQIGKFEDAIKCYEHAIKLNPKIPLIYYNLGNSLKEIDKLSQAELSYKQALSLKSDYVEVYLNLGNIYRKLGKLNDAEKSYKTAISFNPNFVEAHSNLGNLLQELDKRDEAEKHCKKAIELNPEYSEAYNNLGVTIQDQGRLEEAEKNYKKAISLNPQHADAKFNLSLLLNLKGELVNGLKLYEWRLKKKIPTARLPEQKLVWDGKKPLLGKKFLVYEEQGIGDLILFYRYLALLEKLGAEVTFKVKSILHKLFKNPKNKFKFIDKFPSDNKFDYESPLISLPYLFGTEVEKIPASKYYLKADSIKINEWSEKLKSDNFKIGICWQGSKMSINRSFPLSLFKKISMIPGIELISLHKGDGENQLVNIDFAVKHLGPNFDNNENAFIDTSAVMMNCDLIITSDTVIPHLAGALGCPVWLVLNNMPYWPWMLKRKDSPWYPSMRLYRQNEINNWSSVFDKIKYDLEIILNEKTRFKKDKIGNRTV